LISACLFSDGAGAAVLSGTPNSSARRVEWTATSSLHDPAERDTLRFEQRGGMLRNILTPQVPALAAQHAEIVLENVLSSEGMKRGEIGTWILHAGGRKVLAALRKTLGLTVADVAWSSNVLREFGNLSSPFVYFVLQSALRRNAPPGWWWMSSFGAGFSCHGALLNVA
jgi:alkylresorcinol/alkylpyrone synthase